MHVFEKPNLPTFLLFVSRVVGTAARAAIKDSDGPPQRKKPGRNAQDEPLQPADLLINNSLCKGR